MRVFDVVVVGAGPAGSALAVHLARDGYSVLLLEKGRFPRDKVCGDLVSAKGLKLLADIGCYGEIEGRSYCPIQRALVYLESELLVDGAIPQLPEHPPFGHAIPRLELDDLIFRAALAAGAEAVEGCTVLSYERGRSLVTIDADVDGARRQFMSRTIVGADGAGSIVARCAGLEMRDARHVQLAMRAYCHGLTLEHAILFFTEDFFPGYGWVFPVRSGLANIGVGMVKESAKKDGLRLRLFFDRLTELVRTVADREGADFEITRPQGWPINTYGGARRNYFDAGLLVGDAGCFVDPISGEGIPLALESAAMAAATLRLAFTKGEFGAETMADFEQRWRSRYDPDLNISDLIVSAIRNRHLAKLWIHCLRVIGLTAARDRDYALKLGGILAGLVPSREGLSADVIVKSLMHGPAFWLEAFRASPASLPTEILRQSAELVSYETRFAASAPAELGWIGAWAAEVARKQLDVVATLARSGEKDAR
jgi:geranylgeranyl reductase family protein